MLRDSLRLAWQGRRILFATAFIHRLLGIVLLWPLFGIVTRWWLLSSGSSAVTDEAIASFLLTPVGFMGGMICASVGICILALEQSSLMIQGFAVRHGYCVSIPRAIQFGLRHLGKSIGLVARLIVQTILMLAPFVAVAGLVAWWLLRAHDINYFLAERPPAFFWAVSVAAVILIIGLLVILPRLASWSLSLPVLLVHGSSVRQAIRHSQMIVGKHRWKVVAIWVAWFGFHSLLSILFAGGIYWLARISVTQTMDWLAILIPLLGAFAIIWMIGTLALSLFQGVSFAILCVGLFEKLGPPSLYVPASFANQEAWLKYLFEQRIKGEKKQSQMFNLTTASEDISQPLDRRSRRWLRHATLVATVAIAAGLWLVSGLKWGKDAIVIAHRGASVFAPDNTLAAFERAIADRADYIELDVQETSDGEVIVFHDSDFMKSSGVSTRIWEVTYPQVQQIDIGSRFNTDFHDQRAPLLVDALRLCKDRTPIIIELKYYGHNQRLVERVIEIVEKEQMVEQVVLMSLKHELVVAAKRLRPTWRVGLLAAVSVGDLTKMESDFLAVNSKLATRSFIKRAQQRGKSVYVWTIDDPSAMLHYLSLGVDGIITNRPDLAREAVSRLQSMSLTERILLDAAIRVGVVPFKIDESSTNEDA